VKALRWLLHALAGLLLYQVLVVQAGVLAAIATPAGYFEAFGSSRRALAMGLWSLATFALPLGVLAWAGSRAWRWLATRVRGVPMARGDTLAFVAGALACWLFWQLSFFFVPERSVDLSWSAFWQLFWNTHLFPLWHLPSAWAPWVGIALGLRQRRG
jgi:hypothetical protein